jgi:hypothetical protein
VRYAVRISLPDQPGSLSAVTAALTALDADIALIEVVEQDGEHAVDDLWVTSGRERRELRFVLEQVPGVIVESLRPVRRFPDAGDPMRLAARLVEMGRGAVSELVASLPTALSASWSVAVASGVQGLDLLAASANAPALERLEAPWLPLAGPRRLGLAEWMPTTWRDEVNRGLELAAAPLGESPAGLLVGRREGPRFRLSELNVIADLARVAVAAEKAAPRLRTSSFPAGATRRGA